MRDLNEIRDFLNSCNEFFLCTADKNKPHARPFGGCTVYKNRILIFTQNNKLVYSELLENPNIQLVGIKPDGFTWMRVVGIAYEANTKEAKETLLKQCPYLLGFFTDLDDPTLTAFAIKVESVEL